MENIAPIERVAKWQTSTGKQVTVTARLILSEVAYADGDNITIPCCRRSLWAHVEGVGDVGSWVQKQDPITVNGRLLVAHIGKLGLTAEQLAMVQGIDLEITDTPEWQAHEALIARNRASVAAYEEGQRKMGVCPQCGTVCDGDCGAN